jgi:hypothetical protein
VLSLVIAPVIVHVVLSVLRADWGQQKCASRSVVSARSGDLSVIVDRVSDFKNPSRIRRNQVIQGLHVALAAVQEGMRMELKILKI